MMLKILVTISTIFFKFVDWILNREKKDSKQKDSLIVAVNGDVTIVNIKVDDDEN